MKNQLKKYSVNQGVISASGCGDMHTLQSFSNKREATIYYNSIKRDARGWANYRKGFNYLITEIVNNQCDELDVVAHYEI